MVERQVCLVQIRLANVRLAVCEEHLALVDTSN